MTASIINLADHRPPASVRSHIPAIAELPIELRMYGADLPFVFPHGRFGRAGGICRESAQNRKSQSGIF